MNDPCTLTPRHCIILQHHPLARVWTFGSRPEARSLATRRARRTPAPLVRLVGRRTGWVPRLSPPPSPSHSPLTLLSPSPSPSHSPPSPPPSTSTFAATTTTSTTTTTHHHSYIYPWYPQRKASARVRVPGDVAPPPLRGLQFYTARASVLHSEDQGESLPSPPLPHSKGCSRGGLCCVRVHIPHRP